VLSTTVVLCLRRGPLSAYHLIPAWHYFYSAMLTTDLSPHLALVTGATGGIGKATCLALAALGCSIAVHYNAAADDATDLVRQLEEKGVRAKAFQADLGKYDDVRFSCQSLLV
jgi:NADP-dependent 3-hydroxy acid dehydrogenase YdfG